MSGNEDVDLYCGILRHITKNACDEDTTHYIAEVLLKQNVDSLTLESVKDLVGPFLEDSETFNCPKLLEAACENIVSCIKRNFCRTSLLKAAKENSAYLKQGSDYKKEPIRAVSLLNHETHDSGLYAFNDNFLGIKMVEVNFNPNISLSESLRMDLENKKRKEKHMKLLTAWESEKPKLPLLLKTHRVANKLNKLTDIRVDKFSVYAGGRELLKDATLKINIGRKYGLIGRNGVGKSTFLTSLVLGDISGIDKDLSIGCVEQEMSENFLSKRAIDAVLEVDFERNELLQEEASLLSLPPSHARGERLLSIYKRLEEINASNAEPEGSFILAGLGFTQEMQLRKVSEFSGGWRMRVFLARALFTNPDLLCLDEPTNHLDLHAVAWLTKYLRENVSSTLIIVSHVRAVLNEVCTDIIECKNQKLSYYKGNYDIYEATKFEEEKQQQRQFEAQKNKVEHAQKFIDRFRYNASKAALVQSRIKALKKLTNLEAVSKDPTLCFNFEKPCDIGNKCIRLRNVWFSYENDNCETQKERVWIFKQVDLTVDTDSRVAICGVNGSGKSTLLKMICGQLNPTKGEIDIPGAMRIAFFTQYHVDQLTLTLNAVQQLQAKVQNNLKDEEARAFLGKFGISGVLALEPLYVLSGGQKNRVALALMAYERPHILVLDEPGNHLDLAAIKSLIVALNEFGGGVVLVSHDTHFLSCVVDKLYHLDNRQRTLREYKGSVESYCAELLSQKLV